jgi:hypothetical protein
MGKFRLPITFKNKEISNMRDLKTTIDEAQTIVNKANSQATKKEENNTSLTEFDKSLIVEGVEQANFPITKYQKLNPEIEQQLKVVLSELTMQNLSNFETINNAEGISSNGEPFKCFATLNGDGTLIVTPNKVITVNKKDENNYDYLETRKEGSAIKKVSIHTVSGISSFNYGSTLSSKDMRELETFSRFFTNPRNAMNLELKGKTEQEKAQYMLELNKLGIKPAEDKLASIDELTVKYKPEQLEKVKNDGMLLHTSTSAKAVKEDGTLNKKTATILYNEKEETPRTIWMVSQSENSKNYKYNIYRRAANGKYLDASSVTFDSKGNPKYKMVTLDDIEQKLESEGFSVEKFNKLMAKNTELEGKLPQEAEMISDTTKRQKEKEKEDLETENNQDPIPGSSHI